MIITYTFADGTRNEVEVSEELGNFILEHRRHEESAERRHRRHTLSTDALDYEGAEYGYTQEFFEGEDLREQLRNGFENLTGVQKRRLRMYVQGMTLEQIAAAEGVRFQSVDESIRAAQKKFQPIP